jgi:predicted Zn-dependent protease
VRRADALLYAVAGVFGAFVFFQVVERQASIPPDRVEEMADASPSGLNYSSIPKRRRAKAVPTPSDEDIRSRINSATDTYMSDMLVDQGGGIIRWPDRHDQALRVWVQTGTDVRDWDLRYAQVAREAFADWASSDLPMRFDFVIDSATSDVHISWIDRYPPSDGMRVGSTKRLTDSNGWIVSADIQVAVHDSAGTMIKPWDLGGIVRHEAGHALGLGHSRDPHTKMFPTEMVRDIMPADRATLKLLYELPPGTVK